MVVTQDMDRIAEQVRRIAERQNAILNALRAYRDRQSLKMDLPPYEVLDLPEGGI